MKRTKRKQTQAVVTSPTFSSTVSIRQCRFSPESVEVGEGAGVLFVNEDAVTYELLCRHCASLPETRVRSKQSAVIRFPAQGRYEISEALDRNMRCAVSVRETDRHAERERHTDKERDRECVNDRENSPHNTQTQTQTQPQSSSSSLSLSHSHTGSAALSPSAANGERAVVCSTVIKEESTKKGREREGEGDRIDGKAALPMARHKLKEMDIDMDIGVSIRIHTRKPSNDRERDRERRRYLSSSSSSEEGERDNMRALRSQCKRQALSLSHTQPRLSLVAKDKESSESSAEDHAESERERESPVAARHTTESDPHKSLVNLTQPAFTTTTLTSLTPHKSPSHEHTKDSHAQQSAQPVREHEVLIEDFDFSCAELAVGVGDAVRFSLSQSAPLHAEHELYGESDVPALRFRSQLLQVEENRSFSFVASALGEVVVSCRVFTEMRCVVRVCDEPELSVQGVSRQLLSHTAESEGEDESSFFDSDDVFSDDESTTQAQTQPQTDEFVTASPHKNADTTPHFPLVDSPTQLFTQAHVHTSRLHHEALLTSRDVRVHCVRVDAFAFRPHSLLLRAGDAVRFELLEESSSTHAFTRAESERETETAIECAGEFEHITLSLTRPVFVHRFTQSGVFEVRHCLFPFVVLSLSVSPSVCAPHAQSPPQRERQRETPRLFGSFSPPCFLRPLNAHTHTLHTPHSQDEETEKEEYRQEVQEEEEDHQREAEEATDREIMMEKAEEESEREAATETAAECADEEREREKKTEGESRTAKKRRNRRMRERALQVETHTHTQVQTHSETHAHVETQSHMPTDASVVPDAHAHKETHTNTEMASPTEREMPSSPLPSPHKIAFLEAAVDFSEDAISESERETDTPRDTSRDMPTEDVITDAHIVNTLPQTSPDAKQILSPTHRTPTHTYDAAEDALSSSSDNSDAESEGERGQQLPVSIPSPASASLAVSVPHSAPTQDRTRLLRSVFGIASKATNTAHVIANMGVEAQREENVDGEKNIAELLTRSRSNSVSTSRDERNVRGNVVEQEDERKGGEDDHDEELFFADYFQQRLTASKLLAVRGEQDAFPNGRTVPVLFWREKPAWKNNYKRRDSSLEQGERKRNPSKTNKGRNNNHTTKAQTSQS